MNFTRLFDTDSDRPLLHELLQEAGTENACTSKSLNDVMDAVMALSQSFTTLGIHKGDKVLLLSLNRIALIESLLATFNIGAIAVPLSPDIGVDLIRRIIEAMQPTLCFFDAPLKEAHLDALAPSCKVFIALERRYCPAKPGFHLYHDLAEGRHQNRLFPEHEDSHPCIIIHSSGSSGEPKTIFRTHRIMADYLTAFFEYHHEKDALPALSDRPIIVPLTLSHLAGLNPCLTALLVDRPTYIMRYFDPGAYLKLVADVRSDTLILIPAMATLLLRDPALLEKLDTSAVDYCIQVGEACSDVVADRIERAFGARVVSAYGMTECLSGIGYTSQSLENGQIRRGSCGRQLFGEVRLVDPDGDGSKLQTRQGELWVRNHTVAPCYLNAKMNEERFQDGWIRTGDYFHQDEDGYFFWKGRVDDMFVCKGNNIYPAEVEKVTIQHAAIEWAFVAPIRDHQDTTIAAVLVKRCQPITREELLGFLFTKAPAYAVPQFVLFTDELPTVGPGKVNRRAISEMLQRTYHDTTTP